MEVSLRVSVPQEKQYYSAETKEVLKALKKIIEPHNKNVVKHDAARAKIAGSSVETLSSKDVFDGPASNSYRFDLYGKAIELCDKVTEFSGLHEADRRAEHKRVCDLINDWEKKIRDYLTEIGYEKELLHSGHVKSVDLFFRQHPEVQKLIHLEQNYRYGDRLSGGDRKGLVAGMERLKENGLRVA